MFKKGEYYTVTYFHKNGYIGGQIAHLRSENMGEYGDITYAPNYIYVSDSVTTSSVRCTKLKN